MLTAKARLHTDESTSLQRTADQHSAAHETVKHTAGEYVRGDVHYQYSAKGYFSVSSSAECAALYQHCAEKHLHRYLAEFDFRYNNRAALGIEDAARSVIALKGIIGKRLTYRDSSL